MSVRETFDDALNRAIDGLRSGRPIDVVLAEHPAHAIALRPLLETTAFAGAGSAPTAPPPTRLAGNFTIVHAAVQRAQIAERMSMPQTGQRTSTPWWRRRRTVASLTLPVGVIAAIALAGAGGAAAATLAVSGGELPQRLAHAIAPDWVEQHVPGVGNGGANGSPPRNVVGDRTPAGGNAPVTETTPSPNPGEANAPQVVTVSGLITDARGNVFTLTTVDGAWKVNIDGSTTITGTIVDGATATVTGDATAVKNLHAVLVDITSAPSGGGETATTPGPPAGQTPPGQQDDRTPPGQNGAGGGNENGNDGAESGNSGGDPAAAADAATNGGTGGANNENNNDNAGNGGR